MKDFTLTAMFALSAEMLGGFLWPIVALTALLAVLLLFALMRQRGFRGPAARASAIAGFVVGAAAGLAAPALTKASFSDLHGALDWGALILIVLAGFVGATAATFALAGCAWRRAGKG
ncbi:MAG: DUF5368 domain-containing protein [Pseudorhodoplanes sp.]|nr:DUF5368 domain-containing protein [Pseudorhodoplanes sp.]